MAPRNVYADEFAKGFSPAAYKGAGPVLHGI